MKVAVLSLLVLIVVCAEAAIKLNAPAINHEMIRTINMNPKSTWTAGVNKRFRDLTLRDAANMCGTRLGGYRPPVRHIHTIQSLPDSFDARDQWGSQCPSTGEVRDQAACGSCWAFGAVEAMTDRVCIASQGQLKPHLSAEDMLSCCDMCGFGCDGGYPGAAWDYWVSTGLVTGGNYNGGGCYPYQLQPCDHHVNGSLPPCGDIQPTPPCTQQCEDGSTWSDDKHFGASSYSVSTVAEIQQDIMTNGPVEAAFTVYEDFLAYKKGVYKHTTGEMLGGHAIKILGWGVEDGNDYWTVAKSWNEDWGDKGFFKISRGDYECGIEDEITAGLPKLS